MQLLNCCKDTVRKYLSIRLLFQRFKLTENHAMTGSFQSYEFSLQREINSIKSLKFHFRLICDCVVLSSEKLQTS